MTIPSSVTNIGGCSFEYCSSLTSITIPSSVTSIGIFCFSWCKSLTTVTCEIPTAIEGCAIAREGDFFYGVSTDQATLYVPEASLDSYKSTVPWKAFGTILPISTDGIEDCTTGKSAEIKEVFNTEGKRLNGMNRGINIIRMSDGATRKVMK